MSPISICFCLKSSRIGPSRADIFEKDYETVYKPITQFLSSHKNFKISFAFNGVQLEYLRKKHPEFLEIIKQLVAKKQIELIGGGYYDPAFPLLFPIDRNGQIELLTSEIRKLSGKRPRGISICASIWDYSLVSCFNICGMDYVFLDESLIPNDKLKFIPLIMSDKGKSISILPLFSSLNIDAESPCQTWLNEVLKKVQKSSKNLTERFVESKKGFSIQFTHEELKTLLNTGWLEHLNNAIEEKDSFIFNTPSAYLKSEPSKIPVYIPSGMSSEVGQWGTQAYKPVKMDKHYPVTIYDFFQIYPQSRALFDRMLYVSLLVNQSHGDKMRKNAAREKLWEAQNGDGFICTSKGAFVTSTYRQQAYKNLTAAEKLLRECGNFSETATTFDYNSDGLSEYVFRMQNYFSVISPLGGMIKELDILQNSGNFADNLNRVEEFEGVSDDYERGLFVDHLFDENEFSSYVTNKPAGNTIFSKILYSEIKFSESRRELQFCAQALFKGKQKVSLKKNYVLSSSGMMIQYIVKNESDSMLDAKFAVESSFAQTNFNAENFNAFKLEILSDGNKQEINTKVSSHEVNKSGKLSNVEGIWVTDTDNNISFMFEPNESCGLVFVPIVFNRPEYTTGELLPAGMTFANTMFWNVKLTPGMEMEKTINFSIFNMHKRKK